MDGLDFDAVARRCAPNVAPTTLRAMATVESSLNPNAIGIVSGRLQRQPNNLLEAISTAQTLRTRQVRFSAGLIQIYVQNWPGLRLDHESVFDPCSNMRAAASILTGCYIRAGGAGGTSARRQLPQQALRDALSCYYSNNFVTGFQHGYVQKVVSVALNLGVSAPNPARKGADAS